MIWIILVVIIAVIIISFLSSLNKDSTELQLQTVDKKFKVIVDSLNKNLLDNYGKIKTIDKRAFNLYYDGGNKIIQFMYSTGNLNITYRQHFLGEEIVCERLFDNLRNASDEKQSLIAQEFLLYVERKIYALNVLNNVNDFKVEKNNEEITKFKLSSIFYDFCFSKEIAKLFLEENETRKNIVTGMYLSNLDNKYISEKIFKNFAKHKYNLELTETNVNEYCVDGFEFKMRATRLQMLYPNHLELVSHNLDNVKDENGDNALIAEDFIIYCKYDEPKAIFVLIKDNDLKTYFIRRVYENGNSEKIASIKNYNSAIDFIQNYVNINKI